MANGPSVRLAGPADAHAICHLLLTFNEEALSPQSLAERLVEAEDLETVFLAELDGTLAGLLVLRPSPTISSPSRLGRDHRALRPACIQAKGCRHRPCQSRPSLRARAWLHRHPLAGQPGERASHCLLRNPGIQSWIMADAMVHQSMRMEEAYDERPKTFDVAALAMTLFCGIWGCSWGPDSPRKPVARASIASATTRSSSDNVDGSLPVQGDGPTDPLKKHPTQSASPSTTPTRRPQVRPTFSATATALSTPTPSPWPTPALTLRPTHSPVTTAVPTPPPTPAQSTLSSPVPVPTETSGPTSAPKSTPRPTKKPPPPRPTATPIATPSLVPTITPHHFPTPTPTHGGCLLYTRTPTAAPQPTPTPAGGGGLIPTQTPSATPQFPPPTPPPSPTSDSFVSPLPSQTPSVTPTLDQFISPLPSPTFTPDDFISPLPTPTPSS